MGKNVNFVSHKKSKLTVDGKPKLPSAESLVEGELAINFAENVETISLKNCPHVPVMKKQVKSWRK
jgi:hypothetical protein